jgi:hypothetical protein
MGLVPPKNNLVHYCCTILLSTGLKIIEILNVNIEKGIKMVEG